MTTVRPAILGPTHENDTGRRVKTIPRRPGRLRHHAAGVAFQSPDVTMKVKVVGRDEGNSFLDLFRGLADRGEEYLVDGSDLHFRSNGHCTVSGKGPHPAAARNRLQGPGKSAHPCPIFPSPVSRLHLCLRQDCFHDGAEGEVTERLSWGTAIGCTTSAPDDSCKRADQIHDAFGESATCTTPVHAPSLSTRTRSILLGESKATTRPIK